MADNFLPNPDAELLAWSANFSDGINAAAVELGLSIQAAAEYADLHASFKAALRRRATRARARAPACRGKTTPANCCATGRGCWRGSCARSQT